MTGWMWPSTSPGVTTAPLRSITVVAGLPVGMAVAATVYAVPMRRRLAAAVSRATDRT
jgi:hypothetical protein